MVDFGKLAERLAGGDLAATLDAARPGLGALVLAVVGLGLSFALCGFLYRRRIFLRL